MKSLSKEKIKLHGFVPVIVIEDLSTIDGLVNALIQGGIPIMEVTFRTEQAEKAIETIAQHYPDIVLGAGTVLNTDQVRKAVNAGAQFVVTPGYDEEVVDYCLDNDIFIIPGTSNATDLTKATNAGLEIVKFFPSEINGGIKAIKALSEPFSSLMFLPTGGINLSNVFDYLEFDKVIACGGTWMAKSDSVQKEDYDQIVHSCQLTIKGYVNHFENSSINKESSIYKRVQHYRSMFDKSFFDKAK